MPNLRAPLTIAVMASVLTGAGLSVAGAAGSTQPTFLTVRTTAFDAQSVSAPAPGEAVVAGIERASDGSGVGPVTVDRLVGGAWTTQTVGTRAGRVEVFSSGGQTWLLATQPGTAGAPAGPWSLWHLDGTTWLQVPAPAGEDATFRPESGAADGTRVYLWGNSTAAGPARDELVTYESGRWTAQHPHSATPDQPSAAAPGGEIVVSSGHVLADTQFAGDSPARDVVDYSQDAVPTLVDWTAYGTAPLGGPMVGAPYLAVENPTSVYAWGTFQGPAYQGHASQTGACTHLKASCNSPTWRVSSVVRLSDGRQVLGGADDWNTKDIQSGAVLSSTEGGYALVPTPSAAPVPLGGDPGQEVIAMSAAPDDSTVWSVVRGTAGTQVQSVSLSDAPSPTPTVTTPSPAPTTTPPSPAPTRSTPCPRPTKTPPCPHPTRTPRPKPAPRPQPSPRSTH